MSKDINIKRIERYWLSLQNIIVMLHNRRYYTYIDEEEENDKYTSYKIPVEILYKYFIPKDKLKKIDKSKPFSFKDHKAIMRDKFQKSFNSNEEKIDMEGLSDENNNSLFLFILKSVDKDNLKKDVCEKVVSKVKEHTKKDVNIPSGLTPSQKYMYCLELLKKTPSMHTIILYDGNIDRHELESHHTPVLEVWNINMTYYDIIKNKDQPRFKLIRGNEFKESVMKLLEITPYMLPSICIDDPVNRYYNGKYSQNNPDLYYIIRPNNIYIRKVTNKKMEIK